MSLERNATFLSLPERPQRPREVGLTHVIDKGLTLGQAEGMLEIAGEFVDIVKLGWGSSYVTGGLREKIALYRSAGVEVVLGGTFFETCFLQGRLDEWRQFIDSLGLGMVEISDGTLDIPTETKLEWIGRMSADFRVLSEVGSKDDAVVIAPSRWVAAIERELEAGSWKVITEARESGTAGIFRGDGEVRMGLIEDIVTTIDHASLIFEAPLKAQQVWFIRALGPNVNVGNVPPDEVLALETLRLGLRADTLRDIHGDDTNGA
jgi:phosphosulfolactate synthase